MSKLTDQAKDRFLGWKEVAEEIAQMGDDALRAEPDADRHIMMEALTRISPDTIGPEPLVKTAISRLLLTTPYPAAVEARDVMVAGRFHDLMNEWMPRLLANEDNVGQLAETMIYMAADAMGMNLTRIAIDVAEKSFSGNSDTSRDDFQGLASVFAHIDDQDFTHIVVALNVDHPFWTDYYPMRPWDMMRLGAAMLHEMTHVEQEREMLGDDPSPFYAAMYDGLRLVKPFLGVYEIYRSQLNERQCYYRQSACLDIAQKMIPANEASVTQLDLAAHKNEANLAEAMKNFLARAGKPKPQPE